MPIALMAGEYEYRSCDAGTVPVYRQINPGFEVIYISDKMDILTVNKDESIVNNDRIMIELRQMASRKLFTHALTLIKKCPKPPDDLVKGLEKLGDSYTYTTPDPLDVAKKIAEHVIHNKSAALDDGFVSWFFRKMAEFCKQIKMEPAAKFFTEQYAAGLTANRLGERVNAKPKTKR